MLIFPTTLDFCKEGVFQIMQSYRNGSVHKIRSHFTDGETEAERKASDLSEVIQVAEGGFKPKFP